MSKFFKVRVVYPGLDTPDDVIYLARVPVAGDALTGTGSIDRVVGVRLISLNPEIPDPVVAVVFCKGSDEF